MGLAPLSDWPVLLKNDPKDRATAMHRPLHAVAGFCSAVLWRVVVACVLGVIGLSLEAHHESDG